MQEVPGKLVLDSYAKVNLTLEVIGRRPDGYHELATVFQRISLADLLEIEPAEELSLEIVGDAPSGGDNLVLGAARALQPHALSKGAHIRLYKRIPAGSGLAGGSSNAAATLVGLNDLWHLGMDVHKLAAIGSNLGADVPFFLYGGTALGTARGDVIEPLPVSPEIHHLVVSVPSASVPNKTARIFRQLKPEEYTDGERTRRLWHGLLQGEWPEPVALYNGLMGPALREFEWLASYLDRLTALSGPSWCLSGAGPAFYRLAHDLRDAQRINTTISPLPGSHFTVFTE